MTAPRRKNNSFGPTQEMVAEALGLSQSTVALALNPKHQHKLAEATVKKIVAKAEAMGYRPQQFARILRNGRSHTIGVVYHSSYHPSRERVKYLARYAMEANYQFVAMDMAWFGREVQRAQDYLLGQPIEGVILCNVTYDIGAEWGRYFETRKLPAISLVSEPAGEMERVGVDVMSAYREMTQHHLNTGSKRLALLLSFYDQGFLGRPGDSIMQRVEGFKEVILKRGGILRTEPDHYEALEIVPFPEEAEAEITASVVYPERLPEHEDMFALGYLETEKMIKAGTLPDSLICSNDEIASGALRACYRYHVSVPERIRISGTDETPFARYCHMPLTTIAQPNEEVARYSIERIIEMIEAPEQRERRRDRNFPCRLFYRESTLGEQHSVEIPDVVYAESQS